MGKHARPSNKVIQSEKWRTLRFSFVRRQCVSFSWFFMSFPCGDLQKTFKAKLSMAALSLPLTAPRASRKCHFCNPSLDSVPIVFKERILYADCLAQDNFIVPRTFWREYERCCLNCYYIKHIFGFLSFLFFKSFCFSLQHQPKESENVWIVRKFISQPALAIRHFTLNAI